MIKRFAVLISIIFSLIYPCSAEPSNSYELSTSLSEKAFYSKPDLIIRQFEKKITNCQNNFILARAHRKKKKLKNSLLHYANSCFNKKYNFNVRLFADPIYRFVDSPDDRSIFFRDSVYGIASIFYEYAEYEYVLKFIRLIKNDNSALYRDSIILKSKSLQKLGRFKEAIDELNKTISLYQDKNSQSLIHLRLGAIYESAEDFRNASDSYLNVISSGSGVWQNSTAAKRLIFLTTEKKIKLNSSDKQILFASALYDLKDYDRALPLAEAVLKQTKSPDAEKIIVKIHTQKNLSRAISFIREREGHPGYNELVLHHADILREKGDIDKAVSNYIKLLDVSDVNISEKILTRLSFFYEKKNKPESIKYMEIYIKKFPDEKQCGRFIWLMGRYYMKKSDTEKAVEYFTRGIAKYPDNSYTSYCRFWLNKIRSAENITGDSIEFIEDLAVYNPESYHTLSLLKLYSDKTELSKLSIKFEDARSIKDNKQMLFFHTLLFFKTGYDNSYLKRLQQLDPYVTVPYQKLSDLIKNPSYKSSYKSILQKIESYFYAGDTESINREINLIPENDIMAQKDIALAMTVYSIKHKHYNYSTHYAFRLLNLLELKENIALTPQAFSEALYPYAFADCVKDESRRSSVRSELILAIMKVESNFNHNAASPANAEGLMQLMADTAKGISKELGIPEYELKDPCISIKFGAKYIAWLDRYYKGRIEYIVAAYNAGAGNVNKWIKRSGNKDVDYYSEFITFDETRDYIFRTKKCLLQYDSIYKNSEK